jgi:hypothetical protein
MEGALCIEAKSHKMRFSPKNELKMCEESEFGIYKISRVHGKLNIDAKIHNIDQIFIENGRVEEPGDKERTRTRRDNEAERQYGKCY